MTRTEATFGKRLILSILTMAKARLMEQPELSS